ncbi:MAG TPA: poly-gamma-glutamate system protein [Xanthobacteraceae bacterium]|jgi:poly-gamma-glutamate system protein|nr:poly-gamma-glutamate system protein [Xanthobacteraceae bacterium]
MNPTSLWQSRPRAGARVPFGWLVAAAVLSIATWLATEWATHSPTHPHYAQMLSAARTMQSATRVFVVEKETRGLLQPPSIDPNRTGMIGSEFTNITTTLGDIASKRTTTNPDFAAALVRLIASLDLPRGTPVVIIVSGSFPGANVAAIAAVEALGLRPIIVASLGASMWGANDPDFNWLDMATVLRARGVIRTKTLAAVLGGGGSVGSNMDPDGVAALRASAARDGVPLIDVRPFSALVDSFLEQIADASRDGPAPVAPGLMINVGGALLGLGSCRESYETQPGLTRRALPCTSGTPGLALRLLEQGRPMLQVLNMKRLALEMGLPFDPNPLPTPGNNPAIYGTK